MKTDHNIAREGAAENARSMEGLRKFSSHEKDRLLPIIHRRGMTCNFFVHSFGQSTTFKSHPLTLCLDLLCKITKKCPINLPITIY